MSLIQVLSPGNRMPADLMYIISNERNLLYDQIVFHCISAHTHKTPPLYPINAHTHTNIHTHLHKLSLPTYALMGT